VEQKILNKILSSQSILLLSHKDPDGDALGSVSALADFLINQKKIVQIFIPGDINQNFAFLPHFNIISNSYNKNFNLIIACDYSNFNRTGFDEIIDDKHIITFDHHIENEGQRGELKLIDSQACSTCQLLYFFFKKLNIKISKNMATSLLTGILTDTGFFKNTNVTSETFEAVKDLILKGASIQKITKAIYTFPDQVLNLWSEALNRTEFDQKHNIVYTAIPYHLFQKYKNVAKEIGGFSSFINSIYDAKLALTLVEQESGVVRGSIRAKPSSGINAFQIAQKLGGGGHFLAAGFEINECFDKILKKITDAIY